MPLDKDLQAAVAHEVSDQLDERLTEFKSDCRAKCTELFTRMAASERDRTDLHARTEADREMLKIQLATINESITRLSKQLDGNGHGPLLQRVTLVERDIADMKKADDDGKKDSRSFWTSTISQGIVPAITTWLGLGIFYLIYLAVTHAAAIANIKP